MFDYETLSVDKIYQLCSPLPLKLIRWMAIHHPDNGTRVHLFRMTNVPIGEGTVVNAGLTLYDEYQGLVSIGQGVAISTGVTIVASSNPNNSTLTQLSYVQQRLVKQELVRIEDNVWLGANAVILPGITIGERAVVGAGSVVTRDVAAMTVVAGNPARMLRRLADVSG